MIVPLATIDRVENKRETRRERAVWQRVRPAAERYYQRQLRKIAAQIGHVVSAFSPADQTQVAELVATLHRYSAILIPWARAVASRMLYETARRDDLAWRRHATLMGEEIEAELNSASVGGVYQDLMARQVDLITSIPRDAAQRVHKLATEALYEGRRYPDIAAEIMRSNDVSRSKADLIARTEVGRAATTFQQVRAQAIGSTGYIWKAVGDYRTRPELGVRNFARLNTLRMGSHRKLDGTFHRWDDPPIAGPNGERAHPGSIFNCFPGYTLVDWSGARRLFRVFYEGPLVRLETGREVIDCTPNHPILTSRGWVAASQLDTSDDIVCMTGDFHSISCDNKQEFVSSFDDLFAALAGKGSHRIPGIGFDFYGDIVASDVDQVTVDRDLLRYRDITTTEQVRKLSLSGTDCVVWRAINGSINEIILAHGARGLDSVEVLLPALVGCNDLVGEAMATELDPLPLQCISYRQVGDAISSCQSDCTDAITIIRNDLIDGEIGALSERASTFTFASINTEGAESETQVVGVTPDFLGGGFYRGSSAHSICRLQNKSFRDFSGHVYTLETDMGQYGVGRSGIQAKNCRCIAEPILPTTYTGASK